jgi:hypothetical protein
MPMSMRDAADERFHPVRSIETWDEGLYAWEFLHQGGGHPDALAGLCQFRRRSFSSVQGRWLPQDPAAYAEGQQRFEYRQSASGEAVRG